MDQATMTSEFEVLEPLDAPALAAGDLVLSIGLILIATGC
jgi:hypothetical protein